MKYKVIHYIESRSFGGAEQVVLNLICELDQNKWEPVLVYHPYESLSPFIEKVKALKLNSVSIPHINNFRDIKGVIRLINKIREIQPAIFHAHLIWNLRCSHGIIAAYLAGTPAIIATQHLYQEIHARRIYKMYILQFYQKFISMLVDRYIAVSNKQAESLKTAVISGNKVNVVHNGIRIKEFCHRTDGNLLKSVLSNNEEKALVLTVARLDRLKGHRYLIEAATMAPEAKFLLAGDGPERLELENLAMEFNMTDRIIFLGHRNDIPALMNACDLFVIPSLLEGLPLSVMEAMAASIPVIATDIDGINEIIIDGENGFLVPPADAVALAEKINLAISNTSHAQTVAVAGKNRVRQQFSAKKMADGVTKIYEEIIAEKSG